MHGSFGKKFFHHNVFTTSEERATFTEQFVKEHPEYQNFIFHTTTPTFKS
jgi:hypothetical protein